MLKPSALGPTFPQPWEPDLHFPSRNQAGKTPGNLREQGNKDISIKSPYSEAQRSTQSIRALGSLLISSRQPKINQRLKKSVNKKDKDKNWEKITLKKA